MAGNRLAPLALFLAVPAAAQQPTGYDRALAAGSKAQLLCSALWNGGKTREQIEQIGFDLAAFTRDMAAAVR